MVMLQMGAWPVSPPTARSEMLLAMSMESLSRFFFMAS